VNSVDRNVLVLPGFGNFTRSWKQVTGSLDAHEQVNRGMKTCPLLQSFPVCLPYFCRLSHVSLQCSLAYGHQSTI
jgi:hypothetical protein